MLLIETLIQRRRFQLLGRPEDFFIRLLIQTLIQRRGFQALAAQAIFHQAFN